MEKLICPQCGGNDFQLFGSAAYKCESCGTILKDEPEEKTIQEKYAAAPPPPRKPTPFMTSEERYGNDSFDFGDDDDGSSNATKQIAAILLGVVIVVAVLGIAFFEKSKSTPNYTPPVIEPIPTTAQANADPLNMIPDLSEISFEPSGITAKSVDLYTDGNPNPMHMANADSKLQIILSKPKGFTRTGNNVFVGMSLVVKDHGGNVVYTSDDINKTAGETGEDYHHYQKECAISFFASSTFGFNNPGNYKIDFRVWDKKSKKEITGTAPLFINQ